MNETEFTPRCLSGAAELEIDFYRDLYELGVWWALLSSYDRETRARRVLERSRKRKRYKPRPAVSIRKEMEPVPQTAEKPVQAGFFACVKFILMRWFK